jgi:hypothetical protein
MPCYRYTYKTRHSDYKHKGFYWDNRGLPLNGKGDTIEKAIKKKNKQNQILKIEKLSK